MEGYRWHVNNIKHKAILMFIYSAGLRVGEDVQGGKGRKGRKDRYTLLSGVAMVTLNEYSDTHLLEGGTEIYTHCGYTEVIENI